MVTRRGLAPTAHASAIAEGACPLVPAATPSEPNPTILSILSGAREIDVQMLLGDSDLTMTQRYARAYTWEQAVRAHAELSPVARLNAAHP